MNQAQIDKIVRTAQKNEITEHIIYQKLSQVTKDSHNREILLRISDDEKRHYNQWKDYTRRTEKPNWIKVWTYYLVSRAFGLTLA